jgi:hypothetical protein
MDCCSHAGMMVKGVGQGGGHVVWSANKPRPIVSRIAVGGDFLPGKNLMLAPETEWIQAASRLSGHFVDVDTTFVNLEATIDTGDLTPRPLTGLGDIVSAPAEALAYLRAIRSRAFGLANNHTYDFGSQGVARSRAAANRYGLVDVGGNSHRSERPEVFVWQGPGTLRVGFWAAARASSDMATGRERGVERATLSRGQEALEELRLNGARYFIALLHAGCMRTNRPEPEDLRLMNSLAQAGFDLVAASHSHRIAGYQQVRRENESDAFCFFGLGSLVSGYAKSALEREGLVVVAALDGAGELVSLEVRPILLDASGLGTIPTATDHEMIVGRFQKLSAEIRDGSYEKEFYREVSHGLGRLYARDIHAAFRAAGLRGLARKAGRIRMRHVKRFLHKVTV